MDLPGLRATDWSLREWMPVQVRCRHRLKRHQVSWEQRSGVSSIVFRVGLHEWKKARLHCWIEFIPRIPLYPLKFRYVKRIVSARSPVSPMCLQRRLNSGYINFQLRDACLNLATLNAYLRLPAN